MKIKMTSSAIQGKNIMYHCGQIFTVGKDISEELANEFVTVNLAIVIDDGKTYTKPMSVESKKVKPKKEKEGVTNEI